MYVLIDKTTRRVASTSAKAEEVSSDVLFIPAEECGPCNVGDMYDQQTHTFAPYIVSRIEFDAHHAKLFAASDEVMLRHFEGAPSLTDTALLNWKQYRQELRDLYHVYTPTENPNWPVIPT